MNYEIVTLEERRVVGIGTRTANDAPDMGEKIGKLWCDFMCEGGACEKLQFQHGSPCYGIYTGYSYDDSGYDVYAACESANKPEGFSEVVIPAGKYAKFSFRGDVRESTAKAWSEVWQVPLPRAMQVDFEEYNCPDDSDIADISIYIGLADLCQSCGMPMTKPEEYGTEAGGAPSTEYCCYCRKDGKFTADCTMEQMIDSCLDNEEGKKLYSDRAVAHAQMMEYFPTLKRWKK